MFAYTFLASFSSFLKGSLYDSFKELCYTFSWMFRLFSLLSCVWFLGELISPLGDTRLFSFVLVIDLAVSALILPPSLLAVFIKGNGVPNYAVNSSKPSDSYLIILFFFFYCSFSDFLLNYSISFLSISSSLLSKFWIENLPPPLINSFASTLFWSNSSNFSRLNCSSITISFPAPLLVILASSSVTL